MSKSKHLPPIEEESDDTFAFIAGYTPAGFPYGTTWAELGIDPDLPMEEKRRLYVAATARDQLLNVDQGDDDELPF